MKFFSSIFLFCLTVLVFMPHVLLAADNYKVVPRVIDKEVMPRDIFTETVSITNNKTHQIHVYASVNEVDVDSGGDITSFSPPSVSDNTVTPTSWVAISRSRISVQPGQTKEVPIHFKIHPEVKPGVYHVFVGFGNGNNRPTAEKMAKSGQAPGIMVTLNVDQNQTEFLKLGKFVVEKFITKPQNQGISYTLSNPGTAEVVPTGEIIFSDSRGEEVAAITINPEKESLAKGQKSTYTVDAPTEGLLGKYKAFLSIDYGTEHLASVYDTAFFYVIPWQKILIIFLVVLTAVLILTIYIYRKMEGEEYAYDGSEEVPLYVKDGTSVEQEHDINLKQK